MVVAERGKNRRRDRERKAKKKKEKTPIRIIASTRTKQQHFHAGTTGVVWQASLLSLQRVIFSRQPWCKTRIENVHEKDRK